MPVQVEMKLLNETTKLLLKSQWKSTGIKSYKSPQKQVLELCKCKKPKII